MDFLDWLEATRVSEWAQSSAEGYPIVITVHSIGLAMVVGPALMANFRMLGWIKAVPLAHFIPILRICWIGLVLNLSSGLVLFVMDANNYVYNSRPFLVKIACVITGLVVLAYQQRLVSGHAAGWEDRGVPPRVRRIAMFSLVLWLGAITSGRLIAYVH